MPIVYRHPDGRTVRDAATLRRIRSLGIPPAWRHMWICPHPRGHLQAVGYDARGRKQYRYHPRWREVPDQTRFGHMRTFATAAVVQAVATQLGNTPAVCRKSHIHPRLLAGLLDGSLQPELTVLQGGAALAEAERLVAQLRVR